MIGEGTERIGNKNKSGDYPNDNTVEIGQKTKKCPEDLRRLSVTQTPVRNHRLMLM